MEQMAITTKLDKKLNKAQKRLNRCDIRCICQDLKISYSYSTGEFKDHHVFTVDNVEYDTKVCLLNICKNIRKYRKGVYAWY